MAEQPRRSIVREHDFERDLRRLLGRHPEARDAFVEAAEWVLSADPFAGMPIAQGANVWALPMAPVEARSVTLFYTFDAERVIFLAISAFD